MHMVCMNIGFCSIDVQSHPSSPFMTSVIVCMNFYTYIQSPLLVTFLGICDGLYEFLGICDGLHEFLGICDGLHEFYLVYIQFHPSSLFMTSVMISLLYSLYVYTVPPLYSHFSWNL